MSLIKMLKRIWPSIDPWGTPYELDFASDTILSIFTEYVSCHANNLRTTGCLYFVEQVYLVTNNYLHYQRLWKDREGHVTRFYHGQ